MAISIFNLQAFTAVPQSVERLIAFRSTMNRLAIDGYLSLAKEFERATSQSMTNVREQIRKLDATRALDSSLFACVEGAIRAMELGDADAAGKYLNWPSGRNLYANVGHVQASLPDESPAAELGMNHIRNIPTKDFFGRKTEVFATTQCDLDAHLPAFREALRMICLADSEMHREITEIVHRAFLFKAIGFMGGSMPYTLGSIFISLPEGDSEWGIVPYFVEHIVHESSHNMLFAMMRADPIVLNDASESFVAPIRSDRRHMYGVYHASFVVCRMLRIFRSLAGMGHREYEPMVEHFEPRLQSGLSVVGEHGKLSAAGEHLYRTFSRTAGIAVGL